MNSLKYLIKNDLLNEEKEIMLKYFELTKNYRENVCRNCIGTDKPRCRNCSILRGLSRPTCPTMTRNIDKKIKKENEKLMQKIIFFTTSVSFEKED